MNFRVDEMFVSRNGFWMTIGGLCVEWLKNEHNCAQSQFWMLVWLLGVVVVEGSCGSLLWRGEYLAQGGVLHVLATILVVLVFFLLVWFCSSSSG
jgi:hypothetical protein